MCIRDRVAPRQNVIGDDYADAGADRAKEVEADKAPSSPDTFKFGAEHPKRQHIEDDMQEAAVQKSIGGELPNEEISYDVDGCERQVAERPVEPGELSEKANDKDGDVANQQPLDTLREAGDIKCASDSRATA